MHLYGFFFLINTFLISHDQFPFFWFAKVILISEIILISLMMMVDKVVNEKYYGNIDKEKVDLGRLYYSDTIGVCFGLSFFLLEVREVWNY